MCWDGRLISALLPTVLGYPGREDRKDEEQSTKKNETKSDDSGAFKNNVSNMTGKERKNVSVKISFFILNHIFSKYRIKDLNNHQFYFFLSNTYFQL